MEQKETESEFNVANGILDAAYALMVDEFVNNDIKVDVMTDSCIFFNDTKRKKTYCIHLDMTECEEYEGD